MRIGFDFDKVFIDYPPLLPPQIIDFLYKGGSYFKKTNTKNFSPKYRYPGKIEQKLRIFSHYPFLRKPIQENVKALQKIAGSKRNNTYLISSRFSFLKKSTNNIMEKYKLNKYFKEIYFNFDDQQPHLFKEKIIKDLKIEKYVDDDLHLSLYLASKFPHLEIYWITDQFSADIKLPKNVKPIRSLKELVKIIN